MNLYVGNISYDATEDDLKQAFEAHGEVTSVKIIKDQESDRPHKGFGFIEMPNEDEAKAVIQVMDGADLMERPLKVNEARPKKARN